MLRRLRLKFILTNMLLVTVVLLAVFGALMISTAQQLERESAAAMKLALRQDGIPPQLELHLPDQGGAREWRWAIPVFCVTIEADGTLTLEEGSQVKVTEDTLAQAVQEIQEAQAPSGTLQNLGLRFQQEQLSDGRVRIAFSDLSWERASLGRLMVNSLLIGGAALAVFFAISLFLARLSLKPVERAWTQQRQFVADASHELKTPPHGDSGQHRNHGRPPGRHSGLPAQVAGLHPGGGPADEGAGGGHALPGQARRGGAAQGLPHGQFQRPGHRVRAAL